MEKTKISGFRVRSGKKIVFNCTLYFGALFNGIMKERQEVIGEEKRTGQGKDHKVAVNADAPYVESLTRRLWLLKSRLCFWLL